MGNSKERYSIVISGRNIYKIKEKKMMECFDKLITPSDIENKLGNDNEMELLWQLEWLLDLEYARQLKHGLINALDELAEGDKNFDYINKLIELTGMSDSLATEFLLMAGGSGKEDKY